MLPSAFQYLLSLLSLHSPEHASDGSVRTGGRQIKWNDVQEKRNRRRDRQENFEEEWQERGRIVEREGREGNGEGGKRGEH